MTGVQLAVPETMLSDLARGGLLVQTGVDGYYGYSAAFESIRLAVEALIDRNAIGGPMRSMRFPPVIPRSQLESAGYLNSFPQLAGAIFAFSGDETQARELQELAAGHQDWSRQLAMTEFVLTPAACYPLYPVLAAQGELTADGVTVDLGGAYVFRHEPSADPTRLVMFRQREFVRAGDPEAVRAWRDAWSEHTLALLKALGLPVTLDVATDPFFGRAGRMLEISQREQSLKFEAQVQLPEASKPVAVASFNYHQDHFAAAFGISLAGGGHAHTACVGHGEERIVVALAAMHGTDPEHWPADVRARLWPL